MVVMIAVTTTETCSCELCLSEAKKPKFVTEVDLQSTAPTGSITVSKEQRDLFRQRLHTFRDTLGGLRSFRYKVVSIQIQVVSIHM